MSSIAQRIRVIREARGKKRKRALERDLARTVEILKGYSGVRRIILTGSMLTGRVGPGSDVDLVVEGLGQEFFRAVGQCLRECPSADIKPFEDMSPESRKIVLLKGRVVYESGK